MRSSAEDAGDDPLAKPVLQREHIAVLGEMRLEREARRLGVVRLHGEKDPLPFALDLRGLEGGRHDREGIDRAGDRKAACRIADRRDMLGHDVDEAHVMAGALEIGADACRRSRPSPTPEYPFPSRPFILQRAQIPEWQHAETKDLTQCETSWSIDRKIGKVRGNRVGSPYAKWVGQLGS